MRDRIKTCHLCRPVRRFIAWVTGPVRELRALRRRTRQLKSKKKLQAQHIAGQNNAIRCNKREINDLRNQLVEHVTMIEKLQQELGQALSGRIGAHNATVAMTAKRDELQLRCDSLTQDIAALDAENQRLMKLQPRKGARPLSDEEIRRRRDVLRHVQRSGAGEPVGSGPGDFA